MEFVERLRQLIDSKHFTKVALCAKIGITRETLDNYLEGKTSPTTKGVEKMSKKLGEVRLPVENSRSFRDEIFEGDYIGLHKRVWAQLEGSMQNDRVLLLTLAETLKNLTNSSGSN